MFARFRDVSDHKSGGRCVLLICGLFLAFSAPVVAGWGFAGEAEADMVMVDLRPVTLQPEYMRAEIADRDLDRSTHVVIVLPVGSLAPASCTSGGPVAGRLPGAQAERMRTSYCWLSSEFPGSVPVLTSADSDVLAQQLWGTKLDSDFDGVVRIPTSRWGKDFNFGLAFLTICVGVVAVWFSLASRPPRLRSHQLRTSTHQIVEPPRSGAALPDPVSKRVYFAPKVKASRTDQQPRSVADAALTAVADPPVRATARTFVGPGGGYIEVDDGILIWAVMPSDGDASAEPGDQLIVAGANKDGVVLVVRPSGDDKAELRELEKGSP